MKKLIIGFALIASIVGTTNVFAKQCEGIKTVTQEVTQPECTVHSDGTVSC
ncbi:MAG: hypothetical protein QX189_15880 [Methylococcales bacterium]|jgi:hypothetical protein